MKSTSVPVNREPITRLLIANRGEIAVRVIDSCRKLGITAIAIYSEVDRGAKHVALADEAYCIGALTASAGYLDGEKIVALAKRVGAQAVHPGYGFLSENASFAEACESAGIAFVGPPVDVIRRMGSKIESKHIAADCAVPTVPGYAGEQQATAVLRAEAEKIGTPLLIKASAGGGGRGMRVITDLSAFETLLEQSVREAEAAFGDGRVLLEKYIARPRHLEVQVLGDQHGKLVHLFERECSIQRNHQKVIEEAPAAFLDPVLRDSLHTSALKLCGRIGYLSAGTVEFLLDDDTGELFFLEMNTRLQVEHPVTEMITGIDLVEWQIRIASGETLAFDQQDLVPTGWAIEARISAENPGEGYRPETGQVAMYREPEGEGLRMDSGVFVGSEVTPHYDSLLAKLVAHGNSREEARDRLRSGLDAVLLGGIGNNVAFLGDLVSRPAFLSQALTTQYIEQQFPQGWQAHEEAEEHLLMIALLAFILVRDDREGLEAVPWVSLKGWRLLGNAGHRPSQSLVVRAVAGAARRLHYVRDAGGFRVSLDGHATDFNEPRFGDGAIEVEIDGGLLSYQLQVRDRQVLLVRGASSHVFEILPQRTGLAGDGQGELSGDGSVTAPMPGAIDSVSVSVGDRVARGDLVVTMEAMKLVHSLFAGVDGLVTAVHCQQGQSVEANTLLLEIETDEA